MSQREMLQIGDVAERAGVSVRTVRYYEERELLSPLTHTSGGMRLYSEAEVRRLCLIRRLTTLGLSLDDVEGLLKGERAIEGREERVAHSLELLRLQRELVDEQLTAVTRLKGEIEEALANVRVCKTCSAEECPKDCARRKYLV